MTTSTASARGRAVRAFVLLPVLLLAACTRSGDPTMGMTPRASIGGGDGEGLAMPTLGAPASAQAGSRAVAPPPSQSTLQTPAPVAIAASPVGMAGRSVTLQFLPVVGAPPEKVAMLSEALARSAAQRGVTILPSGDETAPLRLKGYLSALGEGGETVVVYVWDVVDASGNRVSRIQGQERVGGSGGDPWDSVDQSALSAIAGRTIDEFLASGSAAG